jgi:hypothetical protein
VKFSNIVNQVFLQVLYTLMSFYPAVVLHIQ